jgi:hypothetical protein
MFTSAWVTDPDTVVITFVPLNLRPNLEALYKSNAFNKIPTRNALPPYLVKIRPRLQRAHSAVTRRKTE